jgi:hypothetical protein
VVAKILGQKILVIFLPKSLEVCKEYYTFATRSRKRKGKRGKLEKINTK